MIDRCHDDLQMGVGIERDVSECVSDHSPLTCESLPRTAVGGLKSMPGAFGILHMIWNIVAFFAEVHILY